MAKDLRIREAFLSLLEAVNVSPQEEDRYEWWDNLIFPMFSYRSPFSFHLLNFKYHPETHFL
jgi:hypothetical protein